MSFAHFKFNDEIGTIPLIAKNKLFFGLPGNPISCAAGFRFFIYPLLRNSLGMLQEKKFKAKLINKWLLEAVNNGTNIEARMNMLTAASMGSTAFQKGLGAIHSLSHPVNALNNVHHGLSNAIFMPYVLTFNKDVIEDKIIKVCDYLELKNKTFDGFISWILDLRKKLEIPHKLSEVIKEKDLQLDRLSKMALEDPSTGGNPKELTEADMKLMYQHSMSGTLFND